ncbi:autotransporter domain-containing protein [Rhodoblastus sp. 17X3]|uniref:autotransporter domain-containing protein n=1 Tax=Rhodoblastus sp. 17X3 TaxID=3047026 RepID=UPI0024B79095|nr:autotransporter domain-containing protein [Rhodoblastus sp. 17X3]MDI9847261.1 autotransporter domain-containing protein [Rhodoblastus sp. 17X3]
MKKSRFPLVFAVALAQICSPLVATFAWADPTLIIDNNRTDKATVPVWVVFFGNNISATNIGAATPIVAGVSYRLSDLASGVDIQNIVSGHVYVSIGQTMGGTVAQPITINDIAFAAPTSTYFTMRLDKMELTYNAPAGATAGNGAANLTTADYFGIPMQLQTTGGLNPAKKTWNYAALGINTATVFANLGKLEGYKTDTVNDTMGAIVTGGTYGVDVSPNLKGVVRIISPSTTNSNAAGDSYFPSFVPYLTYIQTNAIHTDIEGYNLSQYHTGSWAYKMESYIATAAASSNGQTISAGDLVMTGTVNGLNTTIVVKKADLTSYKVYGANSNWETNIPVDRDPTKKDPYLDILNEVVADYLSGLNFGFIGSKVANRNNSGSTIGDSPSYTWYGNTQTGQGAKLTVADAFAAAAPGLGFYNQYAAYLNGGNGTVVTDAYGFAYTDRISNTLVGLDANTTVTLTIMDDGVLTPIPSAWVITVLTANTATYPNLLVGPTASSMLTVTGGGTAILSGQNTYSGGTTINDGTTVLVTNSNPGVSSSIGTGSLTLDSGIVKAGADNLTFSNPVTLTIRGGLFDTNGDTLTWSGAISGDGALVKGGAGTLILTGANTYAAGTFLAAGTLGVGSSGALGTGPLFMASGTTLQFEASWLNIANGIYLDADPNFDTGSNTDAISGVIQGPGSLNKIGSGTLILSGANTYTGATDVQAGTLAVTGSLASTVTVESGAALGGSGTIGGLIANSGAIIAPGVLTPYTTFTVAGAASFAAGSFLAVKVGSAGQNDKLVTTGSTTISGGTVAVALASSSFSPTTRYAILTAEGGVSGTFSSVSTTASFAFIDPKLSYDANDVYLAFAVKPFASAAQTVNQFNTATALQAQPVGSPLYNALIGMTPAAARQAFGPLSGEIHASALASALDDTHLPREAVLDRLASPYGALSANPFMATANLKLGDMTHVWTTWGQGFASSSHRSGDGNAAYINNGLGGFIFGADETIDSVYRLGVATSYTHSSLSDPQRSASGRIDSTSIGLYGGMSQQALQLRGGGFYTFNRFNTNAAFAELFSNDSVGYNGQTLQAFGEVGWRIALPEGYGHASWVEPFAGLLGVQVHSDSFSETGQAAALRGAADDFGYGASTLGARAETTVFDGLTLRGTLGWRYVFGALNPAAIVAFANAPMTQFTVYGARIARSALATELGVDWQFARSMVLGLSYSSLIGGGANDNAVKGKFEMAF